MSRLKKIELPFKFTDADKFPFVYITVPKQRHYSLVPKHNIWSNTTSTCGGSVVHYSLSAISRKNDSKRLNFSVISEYILASMYY